MFHSFRAKLQIVFFLLGLIAIGLTGWEASAGATAALETATYERLTAIRQTRCRQVERYFQDLSAHATALAADEIVLEALEAFRMGWRATTPAGEGEEEALRAYYAGLGDVGKRWYPKDRRTITQQVRFLAAELDPLGVKGRLAADSSRYERAHARFHPTFDRYQKAFGFYDIFLVDAEDERVVYTVAKEIDFGVSLRESPYRESPLGVVVREAQAMEGTDGAVLRDYVPYVPSRLDPAAFIAAPVTRNGVRVGAIVMQVSIGEVNRVLTDDNRWADEGLGRTGQAYAIGPDNMLRSDMRLRLQDPDRYHAELLQAGVPEAVVKDVKRHGTAILRLQVAPEAARFRGAPPGTELGTDLRGARVLRSHVPLAVAGMDWTLVAEIEAEEAFAPVRALRQRILSLGVLIAAGFLMAAAGVARTVTRPLQALAAGLERLGRRDFSTPLAVENRDEIGQLAAAFNRIAEELARTTVSKAELEHLAGQLLTVQEAERSRIARELHDGVTQQLASLAIEAGQLAGLAESETGRRRQGLARIKEQAGRLSEDVHRISRNLHPALLDDLGLVAAIEQECRGFFERGGPPVEFECEGEFGDLRKEAQIAIYRMVQEALQNIEKHAGAENVRLRLERAGGVHMRIVDDGRGFDAASPEWRSGLGLRSMEERVRPLGGRVEVRAKPGAGTEINVWIS